MKFLMLLAITLMTLTAQAKVLKVETAQGKLNYDVTIEACPGKYPTVSHTLEKISETRVIVKLQQDLSTAYCEAKKFPASFFMPLEAEIVDLGLDPEKTELYFEL
jgi:hypothetical protein